MSIRLNVIDREGELHDVDAPAEDSLMAVLRECDYGVAAICGGMCSCATCHVYIADEWIDRLPPPCSDERDLVSELLHRREGSRLSCQIALGPQLDGLRLTIAPEE
jgi:ferredoxin, 2Fe-2S